MDPKTLTLAAIFGAIIWEIFKQLVASVLKRFHESADSKRKMLRQDLECIVGIVCDINEASVNYFLSEFDSDVCKALSKQIRVKAKTAGLKLYAVNVQLVELHLSSIEIRLWTVFKAAASKDLDVTRTTVWADDDSRLTEIFKAAHHLHAALNRARYSAT